jgi:hypothetical protein
MLNINYSVGCALLENVCPVLSSIAFLLFIVGIFHCELFILANIQKIREKRRLGKYYS